MCCTISFKLCVLVLNYFDVFDAKHFGQNSMRVWVQQIIIDGMTSTDLINLFYFCVYSTLSKTTDVQVVNIHFAIITLKICVILLLQQ